MENSNQHKNNISKLHKDKLGMDIPEDFFAKSKENILNKVIKPEKPKQTIFWLRPMVAYPLAASFLLAIGLTFYLRKNSTKTTEQITNTEAVKTVRSYFNENDFLTSSLLVPDSDIDAYLDNYIVNNVVIETELSEQQLENIFINSVLIEDSLINNYLDKSLIENIVL
ncbi:hypothetical protein [Mariniflexile maritimum]|uniref:hypothetical protein n=1 Tax=Mariniflexile maritimum TaxID=2682493 RepID=UPI0012F67C58|nr:hypothetical protein [Mariniflexile maritimum]